MVRYIVMARYPSESVGEDGKRVIKWIGGYMKFLESTDSIRWHEDRDKAFRFKSLEHAADTVESWAADQMGMYPGFNMPVGSEIVIVRDSDG